MTEPPKSLLRAHPGVLPDCPARLCRCRGSSQNQLVLGGASRLRAIPCRCLSSEVLPGRASAKRLIKS